MNDMGIYRLGIGCIIIVCVIAFLFFSVERKRTEIHKIFGYIIITAIAHLVAELGAIYTLTHMDTVPEWLNRGAHQVFLILFLIIFYEIYLYMLALIQTESGETIRKNKWMVISFAISMVGVLVLPIHYYCEADGAYSYGPAVNIIYFSVLACGVSVAVYLMKSRKIMDSKKKKAITIALLSELGVGIYQFFDPACLLSGAGIVMLCIGFYLTVESPDNVLIELLQDEKKKVDDARNEAVMANQAKGTFLAHMSHEIRTPINAILGMDEMILRESSEGHVVEYAEDIKAAGEVLLSLVNEILDLSKIESGKMEIIEVEYNLISMITDLVNMISVKADAEGLEFKVNMDKTLPARLIGDDVRIRQILTNLLTNAIKYTHEGTVELTISGEVKDQTAHLRFSVKDTGIGIKEEDIKNLFEAYKRIEEGTNRYVEGTGLGLNIAMSLLGMMGSKLQVESIYGKGSEFYFDLQQQIVEHCSVEAIEQENDRNAKRQEKNALTAPNARLLVVDDNRMNRKVFISLLKKTQMQIDEAESGFECIEKMQNNYYDIVFLDHMMPEMDGIETLKRVKQLDNYPCQFTPVVALTANAIVGAKNQYLSEGFDDFLSKPIVYKELEALIMKYLKKD